jgi:ferrous iron transport protein A
MNRRFMEFSVSFSVTIVLVSPRLFVANLWHVGIFYLAGRGFRIIKGGMSLLDAPQGKWLHVAGLGGGAHLQARLAQHGLFAGDRLRVLRVAPLKGPLLVEVNGREIALGRGIAAKIRVEVEP